jgi:hypothetical protein
MSLVLVAFVGLIDVVLFCCLWGMLLADVVGLAGGLGWPGAGKVRLAFGSPVVLLCCRVLSRLVPGCGQLCGHPG